MRVYEGKERYPGEGYATSWGLVTRPKRVNAISAIVPVAPCCIERGSLEAPSAQQLQVQRIERVSMHKSRLADFQLVKFCILIAS